MPRRPSDRDGGGRLGYRPGSERTPAFLDAGSSRPPRTRAAGAAGAAHQAARASPRSQPSLAITTMAPRATPRRPQRFRNAPITSPSRVPPDQSGTSRPAAASASSAWRAAKCRGDPSQPGADGEHLDMVRHARTIRCASRSNESAYDCIEPEMSISRTIRRPGRPGRRWRSGASSPADRNWARRVRRRSTDPR